MIRPLACCAAFLALIGSGLVLAQTNALEQARREAEVAAARSGHFRDLAAQATTEAGRARAAAEAVVADIQKIEADITQAEARVRLVERLRARQQARLAEKQQPVARLAAALQTMSRRPPALALVQPGSQQDLVRVRALLASTLPVVRQRTVGLRNEVEAGSRLRAEAGRAAAALASSRAQLVERRAQFARLEQAQSRRSAALFEASLDQTDRSIAFGEEARAEALRMNEREQQARLAGELAAAPAPLPRPGSGSREPSRPARYRLPVQGRLTSGTGEISDAGIHSRGLTFATIPDAPVVAPRAGTVVYAGRFRSYGEVVIIDHGGGWTSTITSMKALRVRRGDRVTAGDPIGRAARALTVELRHQGRPQAITPFLI